MKADFEDLKDRHQIELVSLTNKREKESSTLKLLSGQSKSLEEKMSLLERETSLLNGQIKEISNALSQFNKNGLSASQEANVPSSALTLMMIDNQIEQHRSRMERLQLRVEVAIPQSRSDLQVNLEDSLRKSLIQEKIVSALDSEIQFKQAEHERAVAQLQNSLDEFVSVQAKKNNRYRKAD